MRTNVLKTGFFAVLVTLSANLFGFTATQSGDWSNSATWGGTGPGATVTNDDVIIPAGITVSLDVNVAFNGVANQFTVDGILNTSSSKSLTMQQGNLGGLGDINIHRLTFGNGSATSSFSGAISVFMFKNLGSTVNVNFQMEISDTLDLHDGNFNLNSGGFINMTGPTPWINLEDAMFNDGGGSFSSTNGVIITYTGGSRNSGMELFIPNIDSIAMKLDTVTDVLTMLSTTLNISGDLYLHRGVFDLNGSDLTLSGTYERNTDGFFQGDPNSMLTLDAPISTSFIGELAFTPGSSIGLLDLISGHTHLLTPLVINGVIRLDDEFDVHAGGDLIMATNSTIQMVDGHISLMNGGTFTGMNSYDVHYIGGTTHFIRTEVEGSGLTNVLVAHTGPLGKIALNRDFSVPNLTITTGNISLNAFDLTVSNSFSMTLPGLIWGDDSSGLYLNVISPSDTIWFESSNAELDTLSLNLPASNYLLLGTDLRVWNALIINSGILHFDNEHFYLFGDYIATPGAHLTSTAGADFTISYADSMTSNLNFTPGSAIRLFEHTGGVAGIESPLIIDNIIILHFGHLNLRPSGNIIMATNSTVRIVDGHFDEEGGLFTGVNSYNLQYFGGTHYTRVEVTGPGLTNMTINHTTASHTVAMDQNLTIPGFMDIMNGYISLDSFELNLNGTLDMVRDCTAIRGGPQAILRLNLDNSVGDTVFFPTFGDFELGELVVNIPAGSTIALGGHDLTVNSNLSLLSGKLSIPEFDLIIPQNGTITGYSDTRYVITDGTGSLVQYVQTNLPSVAYPVGTSVNFSPAFVQQLNAGSSGLFKVRVAPGVYDGGTTGNNLATIYSVVDRTWFISADSPNPTIDMNLRVGWKATSEVNSFNRNAAWISHHNGINWDMQPAGAATSGANNTFELTRSGIPWLSPFAVVDNTTPLGIPTSEIDGAYTLYPNPASDFVVIEVNNPANDAYKYEVFDATGRSVMIFQNTNSRTEIDLTSLSEGYYFIKATNLTDNSFITERVVKK